MHFLIYFVVMFCMLLLAVPSLWMAPAAIAVIGISLYLLAVVLKNR